MGIFPMYPVFCSECVPKLARQNKFVLAYTLAAITIRYSTTPYSFLEGFPILSYVSQCMEAYMQISLVIIMPRSVAVAPQSKSNVSCFIPPSVKPFTFSPPSNLPCLSFTCPTTCPTTCPLLWPLRMHQHRKLPIRPFRTTARHLGVSDSLP